MEHVLLFSLLLLFSTGLCAGNNNEVTETGTAFVSKLAAMRKEMDSLKDTVQQLATVQAKLKTENKGLKEVVQGLKTGVQGLKTENQGLKKEVQGLKTENQGFKKEVQGLKTENQGLKTKVQGLTENQMQCEQLKDIVAKGRTRLAFSATLGKTMGPLKQDTPVKYPRVLSNVGSGYNPATGRFTAPVRGVYYFIYTMYNNPWGRSNSVLGLMKNNESMVSTWDWGPVGDANDSATNMIVVQLEVGDYVYVKLVANRQIYDDRGNYNSFAGFLLFTV